MSIILIVKLESMDEFTPQFMANAFSEVENYRTHVRHVIMSPSTKEKFLRWDRSLMESDYSDFCIPPPEAQYPNAFWGARIRVSPLLPDPYFILCGTIDEVYPEIMKPRNEDWKVNHLFLETKGTGIEELEGFIKQKIGSLIEENF
jgi:hypothetical protein